MRHTWGWFVVGLVSIGLGLTFWFTAFVLVPGGVALITVGTVKSLKRGAGPLVHRSTRV